MKVLFCNIVYQLNAMQIIISITVGYNQKGKPDLPKHNTGGKGIFFFKEILILLFYLGDHANFQNL
jgi:hypothetical protein